MLYTIHVIYEFAVSDHIGINLLNYSALLVYMSLCNYGVTYLFNSKIYMRFYSCYCSQHKELCNHKRK